VTVVVWRTEWLTALRRRRLFLLNTLIPLAFVATIAFSPAPAVHSAAVFTVLFTLFGTFGSSIPLIRDGESGLLRRYILTGVHPAVLLFQHIFATAAIDLIQLTPSIFVLAIARGSSAAQLAMVAPAMVLGMIAANTLGTITAAVAKSVAEGALFSAVAALVLLHLSGAFRTPAPGTWQAVLEAWSPFRPLHESLLAATGAGGPDLETALLTLPIAATLAVLLLVAASGRHAAGLGGR
jgi:hypothetical protein